MPFPHDWKTLLNKDYFIYMYIYIVICIFVPFYFFMRASKWLINYIFYIRNRIVHTEIEMYNWY